MQTHASAARGGRVDWCCWSTDAAAITSAQTKSLQSSEVHLAQLH